MAPDRATLVTVPALIAVLCPVIARRQQRKLLPHIQAVRSLPAAV
jgi:hypothetical protein